MRLLVAYDDSEGAGAALRAAVSIARECRGEVIAVRVLNPRTDATDVVADTTDEAIAQVAARERERLNRELGDLDDGVDVEVVPLVEQLQRGEDVADRLTRLAEERAVDLIAIGSERAAGVKGLLLGSVTQHTLRVSKRPVLVVRP